MPGVPKSEDFIRHCGPSPPTDRRVLFILGYANSRALGSGETAGPTDGSLLPGPGMRMGSVGKSYPHLRPLSWTPDENGVGEIDSGPTG